MAHKSPSLCFAFLKQMRGKFGCHILYSFSDVYMHKCLCSSKIELLHNHKMSEGNFSLLDINCTANTLKNMSILCIDGQFDTLECFPFKKNYSYFMGFWCIFNSAVGSVGNLFTILALGYATHKKL